LLSQCTLPGKVTSITLLFQARRASEVVNARWSGSVGVGAANDSKKKLDKGQDNLNTVAHDAKSHWTVGFRPRLASKAGILNTMPNGIILTRIQPHAVAMNATVNVDAFDTFTQKRSAADRATRDPSAPSGRRDRSTTRVRKSRRID